MTSKSSSLANPVTIQKQLCMRRLWLVALLSVYSFLAGPVLSALVIAADRANMGYRDPSELFANGVPTVRYYALLQRGIRVVYGLVSPVFVGTLIWAFIIGLAVFAYLNDPKKMDFYESQPMKRDRRFVHMYLNGLVLFGITTFAGMLLTELTVLLFGAMSPDLFLEILISWGRQIVFFLACYGIVTLGAMVSGNLVIGFFAALFLYLLEPAAYMVRVVYRTQFLRTYLPGEDVFRGITSPVYQYARGWSDVERFVSEANSAPFLLQRFSAIVMNDVRLLIMAAVGCALTYAAYRYRKTEDAGGSVIFSFARLVIKVAVAVIAALLAGIAVYYIVDGDRMSASGIAIWVFIIILTAVLVCLFMESVFQMNVKAMLKHAWQGGLAIVIALAIFMYYKTGAMGYDTYVPDVADVTSGAIVRDAHRSIQIGQEHVNMLTYSKEHMFIEDGEALCEVLRAGMERMIELHNAGRNGIDFSDPANEYAWLWDNSVEATIVLRLKGGRQMVRSIMIPSDIDAQYMDRLINTDAYKNVAFRTAYLDPEALRSEAGEDAEYRLVFEGMLQRNWIDGALTEELMQAYRKDLESYSYSLLKDEMPLGNVTLQFFRGIRNNVTLPVYPSFTNTIAFLEREGVSFDVSEIAGNINSITLHQDTWYDITGEEPVPDWLSKWSHAITEPGRVEIDKTYTDPEEIEAIVRSVVMYNAVEDGVWFNRDSMLYRNNIEISVDGKTEEYDIVAGYYTFVKENAPDFIATDFIT